MRGLNWITVFYLRLPCSRVLNGATPAFGALISYLLWSSAEIGIWFASQLLHCTCPPDLSFSYCWHLSCRAFTDIRLTRRNDYHVEGNSLLVHRMSFISLPIVVHFVRFVNTSDWNSAAPSIGFHYRPVSCWRRITHPQISSLLFKSISKVFIYFLALVKQQRCLLNYCVWYANRCSYENTAFLF